MCTHIHIFSQHILATHSTLEFLPFFLADESTNEEISRPKTKEEKDVDTLYSWVQVGGVPAHPEEEAQGLLLEVSLFLSSLFLVSMWLSTSFYIPTPVLFHLLGVGSTEKGGCSTGGSPEIRDAGTAFGG